MADTTRAAAAFDRLVGIVRYLRGPDGCPWDRAQTLETLRAFVLEETYEVLEALDRNDRVALREELGDFVFEAVLLAQVCEEAGDFSIADSLESISNKLVRRHVHVFGPKESAPGQQSPAPSALTPDEVVQLWEGVKSRETSEAGVPKTTLGGVPKTLPALLRAQEIGTRAAAVGFDWERATDVLAKIEEEVAELRETVASGVATDRARTEEELGDFLFAITNLARKLGIEPESALRKANDKFTRRFAQMEANLREHGRSLTSCTLDELETEWTRVKLAEHPGGPPAPRVDGAR